MVSARKSHLSGDLSEGLILSAAYGVLGALVLTGRTSRVDRALRRSQRHPRGGPRRAFAHAVKVVARPEIQIAAAGAVTVALHLAGVRGARAILGASLCSYALDRTIKPLAQRRRPPGYHERKKHESFPSGHTAATTALTLTIARVLEREGIVRAPFAHVAALVLSATVGESRLMLDEHWPTDVVAGALLGAAASSYALAGNAAL